MIDGRSVYTPLFGGVFWDVQSVLLEDVDRIEVVSGPGGTLWGANAVNGVINIVTRSANASQGWYVSGIKGSFLQDAGTVRFGGSFGAHLFYRVYGQGMDHASSDLPNGADAKDAWNMTQGGFRMDYNPSAVNTLTLQGDLYGGHEGVPTTTNTHGQNVLGRWTRIFSDQSNLSVQTYFDRTSRRFPGAGFTDELQTYDVDVQYRIPIGTRHSVLWGADYRLMQDTVTNTPATTFLPPRRRMQLVSGFVQDEVVLAPDLLKLTLGTKLEHNAFSGADVQPSMRIAWTPTKQQTVWTAVSRAIRSPARLDADLVTPFLVGDTTLRRRN